jgi:hypothetical protein
MLPNKSLTVFFCGIHQVTICTGALLFVGHDYGHHDINTFGGCSGAVVFLFLDKPEIVLPHDYGKAVTVHAAGHPPLPGILACTYH